MKVTDDTSESCFEKRVDEGYTESTPFAGYRGIGQGLGG
jgi:hypothetical protein